MNTYLLYLKRINYKKQLIPNKATLFELQECHLLNVPFENLDIHYQKAIVLDLDAIFNKVVLEKRGGFCYELNGLFYTLLTAIGFNAKMISARVINQEGIYGQEYDHLAILVTIDRETYLVDVGFGQFSLHPLLVKTDCLLKDPLGNFQLELHEEEYLRVSEEKEGLWMPVYIFKPIERQFSEFEEMCQFHQTSEASPFTKKKVISILTNEGRITLNDNLLKITKNKEIKETEFSDVGQFEYFLKLYFDIKIVQNKDE